MLDIILVFEGTIPHECITRVLSQYGTFVGTRLQLPDGAGAHIHLDEEDLSPCYETPEEQAALSAVRSPRFVVVSFSAWEPIKPVLESLLKATSPVLADNDHGWIGNASDFLHLMNRDPDWCWCKSHSHCDGDSTGSSG
jgi:hypothetical protein